ncbi:MAG: MFS transporter [Chloroflexi bacterium]|nr:MFS transporter [Chloroflexota bacterium]MBU1660425.1 MFS transporter [Chloroflexota bacterium]
MIKNLRLRYRISRFRGQYPAQFWLLFWGMMISTLGASMIWPFLMIYVSERLDLPMATVASLLTLNAATGLLASLIAGPIVDRSGRKWAMVISLAFTGLTYLAMIPANSLLHFAILMAVRGLFNPLYRIGTDAMLADLIPSEQRADAYALTRLSKNVGVSLGPAIGGLVASASYNIAFQIAAVGLFFFSLLIAFFATETLPKTKAASAASQQGALKSYAKIFADKPFMLVAIALLFIQIGSATVWVLLAVYAKQNFQVLESQYGLIPMTNALMVVLFQVFVTRVTKRRFPPLMMALGAFFYAAGVGSIAMGDGFLDFWTSMIVMTIGELILVPTAITFVADLAPPDMRGRYMSVYSLTWGVASGIGPVVGGYLNDNLNPRAMWYGGGAIALLGMLIFLILAQRMQSKGWKNVSANLG